MMKEYHLTKEGLNKLKKELEELKEQRHVVAEKLKSAKEQGDLSENAEWDAAKDEQGRVERRIAEIDHILQNADVIERKKSSTVVLGSEVHLENGGKDLKFIVVDSLESNPLENKISDKSPIGSLIMGKKVGDEVVHKTPSGERNYKIKKIC